MYSKIKNLEESLKRYATKYYQGTPEISDESFDDLVEELRELSPDNELLATAGWGYKPLDNDSKMKVKHTNFMSGITKVRVDGNEVISDKLKLDNSLVTPKLDGAAVEITYDESGQLYDIITRGDGEYGYSVLDRLSSVVPSKLPNSLLNKIRSLNAEVVMNDEVFYRLYDETTHPRNIVSGLLNRIEVDSLCDHLKVIVHGSGDCSSSQEVRNLLTELKEQGELVVPFLKDELDVAENYEQLIKVTVVVDSKTYRCDGVVLITEVGEKVAYKRDTEVARTQVVGIEWNMSRLGTYIPVVKLRPVALGGAVIKRASAGGYKRLVVKGIGVGSEVEIIRSGEIIPYIKDVLVTSTDQQVPTKCYHCGHDLDDSGNNPVCRNTECCMIKNEDLRVFTGYMSNWVRGVGPQIMSKFVELVGAVTFTDFYDGRLNELKESLDNSATSLLYKQMIIEINSNRDLAKLLRGLNIEGLGYNSSYQLAEQVYCQVVEGKEIIRPKGVSSKVVVRVKENLELISKFINELGFKPINPKSNNDSTKSLLKVCVTGTLNNFNSRQEFFETYKDKVIEVTINKSDYLVTNSTKMTSKYKYAKENGIKIVNEEQIANLLNN